MLENQNQISLRIQPPESSSKPRGKNSTSPLPSKPTKLCITLSCMDIKSALFSFSFLSVLPAGKTGSEECPQVPVVGDFARGSVGGVREAICARTVAAADPCLVQSPSLSPGCQLQLRSFPWQPGSRLLLHRALFTAARTIAQG